MAHELHGMNQWMIVHGPRASRNIVHGPRASRNEWMIVYGSTSFTECIIVYGFRASRNEWMIVHRPRDSRNEWMIVHRPRASWNEWMIDCAWPTSFTEWMNEWLCMAHELHGMNEWMIVHGSRGSRSWKLLLLHGAPFYWQLLKRERQLNFLVKQSGQNIQLNTFTQSVWQSKYNNL